MAQPSNYHEFADQRTLWGVPFAMDVLSKAAFALAGIAGCAALVMLPLRSLSNVQHAMASWSPATRSSMSLPRWPPGR